MRLPTTQFGSGNQSVSPHCGAGWKVFLIRFGGRLLDIVNGRDTRAAGPVCFKQAVMEPLSAQNMRSSGSLAIWDITILCAGRLSSDRPEPKRFGADGFGKST